MSGAATHVVQSCLPETAGDLHCAVADLDPEVDLLEVRGDRWGGTADALAVEIAALPRPVIATVRWRGEGGHFAGGEGERRAFLEVLARVAAFVDIELESGMELDVGPARRIVSHHDFAETPRDLTARARRLEAAAGPGGIAKIAALPRTAEDLRHLLELPRALKSPLAVMALGPRGTCSRTLAGRIGSALVYASSPGTEATGPGQLDVRELVRLYRPARQSTATQLYCVVGNPLGHSLSPLLHNEAFRHHQLDGVYFPLEVERFADALELARVLDVRGMSVTIPFKGEAAAAAGRQGDVVNTMVRQSGGWRGINTDRAGFLAALRRGAPTLDLGAGQALVLGAGGAAQAAVEALGEQGMAVLVTSRTESRARDLARACGARALPWERRTDTVWDLLVNATPVGMHPHPGASPFPAAALHPGGVVLDMVYRPRQTQLLGDARAAGLCAIDGSGMFLGQAALQYREFAGCDAPLELWGRLLDQALAAET